MLEHTDTHGASSRWPALPDGEAKQTIEALHLVTQIVGKVRVALSPWLNHGWHSTLYVTARGLTTSPIPYEDRVFEIDIDLLDHVLRIADERGAVKTIALGPGSIAEVHARVLETLERMGIPVTIHGRPNEVPDPIPFAEDRASRPYDRDAATRYFHALACAHRVFQLFRTGFLGKASPVHLFFGAFDLAVTRFSGRPAPPHPGGIPHLPDAVSREAYSHEVSSAGFWPGGGGIDEPAFYSYAYPMPEGFADAPVSPRSAFFFEPLGEFVLPYEAVRLSPHPDETLLTFLQSTYEAAANAAGWDRDALECELGRPRIPRRYP